MKTKYVLLLAAAMFTFGTPVADAAPKKSKKAKVAKKTSVDNFDIFSPSEISAAKEEKKAAAKAALEDAEAYAASEKERLAAMSREERLEEEKMIKADTKHYIANQKKTLKILRSVRNEKSAAKAVKPLEKIYGEVHDEEAAQGTLTALGTVKIMEEDETKLSVHQASRSIAAALNKAINKEINRIAELGIEHKKFNGAMKNMIDAQR